MALMAARLMGSDGQGGVEQQHTLCGPSTEVAAGLGNIGAEVGINLGDDVDQ